MPQTRTPEQIRASIELNRRELGTSIELLRREVTALTDWRQQLRDHRREALIAAAVAGFVIGGGIAGVTGILFGRKRRRR
jgi:hypothetical protein